MAEGKKTEDRTLAALCYIPIFMLNFFVPLYIILAKKGGKFEKFHALQGLSFFALVFVAGMVMSAAFMGPVMQTMFSAQKNFYGNIQQANNSTAAFDEMAGLYSKMFEAMMPMMLINMVVLVAGIAFAAMVFTGRKLEFPIIWKMIEKNI